MKKLYILLFSTLLLACGNQHHSRINYTDFVVENKLKEMNAVTQFRFQGWQPLSDRFMILRSNQQKSYLIKLMSPCIDLPFANNIQLKQDMSNRLQSKFDSVVVPGQFRQTCRIDNIYLLDKDQRKDLLAFSNQKEQIRVSN